jgi:chemotaxis protein CheD
VVGIGEFAVSNSAEDIIVTHALGSCVAVCLWDPEAQVIGLIHVLLPDSRLNPARAKDQPACFADSGIPLLFQAAYKLGAKKERCEVRMVGGAEINGSGGTGPGAFNVGKRNIVAVKNVLWRNGVFIKRELVGGTAVRTVYLRATDGLVQVVTGREVVAEL